jgi:DNA-binding response OmpR family regulator
MTPARPRLLVVDDDRVLLSTLVAGLARAGFDVVVATNGDEAMRVAVDVQPALAVLEVQMAGRSGLDVAEFLARETRVPFLFLSSDRDEELKRRAASFGAMDYLLKPVDMTKLVPAIRSALARSAALSKAGDASALLSETLAGGHGPQALIAIGILAERHKVNCDEAVQMLRQRALAAGHPVDEVALAVIEQAESVARLPGAT